MNRIVFFGVDGIYSTVPLDALVANGLTPSLVIVGLDPTPGARATITRHPAKPTFSDRLRARPLSPLAEEANVRGIDAIGTDDANCESIVRTIATLEPDAFVIAGFPHLLSKKVLSCFRSGGLNIHPGRLPEERGASPLFWAFKEGRTTIDWTIHLVDEGEDSGDIVATGAIDFEPGLGAQEILSICAEGTAPSVVACLRGLLAGTLMGTKQDPERVGRRRRPKFRDGRIDPARTAREVYTFVAACAQNYSLFVESGGDRFFIQGPISYDPNASLPFEYVLTGDRLILRCQPGIVELELKEGGALFVADYQE